MSNFNDFLSANQPCPLCQNGSVLFYETPRQTFFQCQQCEGIFLNPAQRLTPIKERMRYDLHQNDPDNSGYKAYVKPVIDKIKQNESLSAQCLDYGSGPSSVVIHQLEELGYKPKEYDPFFHPDTSVFDQNYHFITCTEVMEHFYKPLEEFQKLYNLLLPGGQIYCMTRLYDPEIDFSTWFYKNDATHVFIYTEATISYLKTFLGFKNAEIEDRLITFTK
jgi:hypothetical protein